MTPECQNYIEGWSNERPTLNAVELEEIAVFGL